MKKITSPVEYLCNGRWGVSGKSRHIGAQATVSPVLVLCMISPWADHSIADLVDEQDHLACICVRGGGDWH